MLMISEIWLSFDHDQEKNKPKKSFDDDFEPNEQEPTKQLYKYIV